MRQTVPATQDENTSMNLSGANQTFIAYEVSESNYTGRSRPSTAGSRRSSVGCLGSSRFSDKWATPTPRGKGDVKKRPIFVGDHS